MLEVLLATTLITWGIADFLAGKAAKDSHPLTLAAWTPLLSLPVAAVAWYLGADLTPSPQLIILAFLSIITLVIGRLAFYQATRDSEISMAMAFFATYPLISLLAISLIKGALPSLPEILGVLIIVAGAMVLQAHRSGSRGLTFSGIIIAVGFGLWAVIDAAAMQIAKPIDMIFWFTILFTISTPVLIAIAQKRKLPLKVARRPLALITAGQWIGYLGLFAFYKSLKVGNDLLVIAIISLTPLVTSALCLLLKEERWHLRRALSLLIIISGVIVIRGG